MKIKKNIVIGTLITLASIVTFIYVPKVLAQIALPTITTACEAKDGQMFAFNDGFSLLKKCPANLTRVVLFGGSGGGSVDQATIISIQNSIADLQSRVTTLEKLVPTPSPISSSTKRVFVTSTSYDGNLGGLDGADSKCQTQANTAGLNGTWKAWLRSETVSAASRLSHNNGSYVLTNGNKIADNWSDLTDGSINYPINVNETGALVAQTLVWTQTFSDGTAGPPAAACSNWTSNSLGADIVGDTTKTDGGWSNSSSNVCSSTHSLYCFEQ